MTPAILAQSALFIAIFYRMAVIWERGLGILHKLLATPAPRTALVLGKALCRRAGPIAGCNHLSVGAFLGC
jgi:ABC-2 type transport system permease protein